jgi:DNA replication protein DnaC
MGKLKISPVSMSMANVSNDKRFGGLITLDYPVPCFRCQKKVFHICKDGDDWVAFCSNNKCLNDDCLASRAIANTEYAKKKEKNEYGQVITGAEKFGMGSSYKNACLAKWVAPRSCQDIANFWMKDFKPFLVVMGNPGTGKTYLSAAILNMLFENKNEVLYTTHRRFIEEIHRAIEDGKTQHSVIEKYSNKKYLIIDDLGAATCTDWQKEMILELIDRRYSDQCKTMITSNLNEKQIKEMLGQRTSSRLFDQKNAFLQFWTNDNRQDPEYMN